jgi:tRNA A37 threonylcarbamoyladenosine synthetase subunit TsaC/SUA5/YrdC
LALALLEFLEEPIMTTTLRLPDEPYPLNNNEQIQSRVGNHVDLVIDGGPCGTVPTTLVDLTGNTPVILRRGKGEWR